MSSPGLRTSCGVTILSILADGRCEAKLALLQVSSFNVLDMDVGARRMRRAVMLLAKEELMQTSLRGRGQGQLKLTRSTMLILVRPPNGPKGRALFETMLQMALATATLSARNCRPRQYKTKAQAVCVLCADLVQNR